MYIHEETISNIKNENFVILAVDRKGKIVMFQWLIILCKPSVS